MRLLATLTRRIRSSGSDRGELSGLLVVGAVFLLLSGGLVVGQASTGIAPPAATSNSSSGSVPTPTEIPTVPSTPTEIPTVAPTETPTPTVPSTPTTAPTESPTQTETRPGTATPSPTPTDTGIGIGPTTTDTAGVSFTVPESLQDEVDEYRSGVSAVDAPNAFVLATRTQLFVVFTDRTPQKGRATVSGLQLNRNLSTENITYGVIAANTVSFETTGEQTTVQEINSDPGEYRLSLVRLTAHYRRVTALADPDQGSNVTAATTLGTLTTNPVTAASITRNVARQARSLSRQETGERAQSLLTNADRQRLYTTSFETKFWASGQATVDAIVLSPNDAARQFIDEYDSSQLASGVQGEPLLYVVEEDFSPQSVDSVRQLKTQSESLGGEVVSLEARLYQQRISVQEAIEHNTGCSEDVLKVQTPQAVVCANVPVDELLHGGVAWTQLPQSRDDVLFIVGVSSRHQDEPQSFVEGRYRIEGTVLTTSQINESLPEATVLLTHNLTRVGEINYNEVQREAKQIIETRAERMTALLREQVGGNDTTIRTAVQSKRLSAVSPGSPTIVEFTTQSRGAVTVEQAQITPTETVQELTLTTSKIAAPPTGVPQPPGSSIQLLNISSSTTDAVIDSASIQIRVATRAIPSDHEVRVYRYTGSQWETLETRVVSRTSSEITVEAETSGFSSFAVTSQQASQTETPTATPTSTPTPTATAQSTAEAETPTAGPTPSPTATPEGTPTSTTQPPTSESTPTEGTETPDSTEQETSVGTTAPSTTTSPTQTQPTASPTTTQTEIDTPTTAQSTTTPTSTQAATQAGQTASTSTSGPGLGIIIGVVSVLVYFSVFIPWKRK